MTRLEPGSTVSRLAAVALLLLVALAGWTLVVAPLIRVRDTLDAEIALTRAGNARLYAQVAATPFGQERAVLNEPTPALAAARLQGEVETIVQDAGGEIGRLEASPLPRMRTSRRLDPVRAAIAFTATTAQLRAAMLGIEAAPTAMIVEELSIAPAAARSGEDAHSGEDGRLSVELAVRAFRLRTGPR